MKKLFRKLLFALLDKWFAWHIGPRTQPGIWLIHYYYRRTELVSRDAYGKISWPRIARIHARDVLMRIFSEQTRAEWAVQKLYMLREEYLRMRECHVRFCDFVPLEASRRAAMETWDFSAVSGKVICFFCRRIDDVREIASSVAPPNQCSFVERVFEESINTGQIKYVTGDAEAIRTDASLLLLALEFAQVQSDFQRLHDGMAGWLKWEKTPQTLQYMRDDFLNACSERAALLGFQLAPSSTPSFPYQRVPVGGI